MINIYKILVWISLIILLALAIGATMRIALGNDEKKVLIEIEWKHHKRLVCLPRDVTQDQIQDIGRGFAHISYAQGNGLHILRFGQVRIYVIEEWDKKGHMKGFDIIGIDTTSFDANSCKYKTRFYIHYPQFLGTAEITGTEFDALIGFYRWEYKRK